MITTAQENRIMDRFESYFSTGYESDYKALQIIKAIIEDEKEQP